MSKVKEKKEGAATPSYMRIITGCSPADSVC